MPSWRGCSSWPEEAALILAWRSPRQRLKLAETQCSGRHQTSGPWFIDRDVPGWPQTLHGWPAPVQHALCGVGAALAEDEEAGGALLAEGELHHDLRHRADPAVGRAHPRSTSTDSGWITTPPRVMRLEHIHLRCTFDHSTSPASRAPGRYAVGAASRFAHCLAYPPSRCPHNASIRAVSITGR